MTMIQCPECGREISDTAVSCPYCGRQVKTDGQQVDNSVVKGKGRKKIIAVCTAVIIILGVMVGLVIHNINEQKAMEEYQERMNFAVEHMGDMAAAAETSCGLIHDVWYNTIYEKSSRTTDKFTKNSNGKFNKDFNDSLRNLLQDDDFKSLRDIMTEHQNSMGVIMKELTNPPDQYKDAYDAVWNLYEAYLDLTNLAVNPTGSLQSYTQNYNTADANFVKYYKAASIYTD